MNVKINHFKDNTIYTCMGQIIQIRSYDSNILKWLNTGDPIGLGVRINRAFKNGWKPRIDKTTGKICEFRSYSTYLKLVPFDSYTVDHTSVVHCNHWQLQDNS